MLCPYCAEEVKNEALVCKHCQRELFVVKPLLAKIKELTERVAALEKGDARQAEPQAAHIAEEKIAVPKLHQAIRPHELSIGLPAALSVVIGYIVLIAIHYIIIVKWDLRLIYYQFTSIVVPVVFGLLYRQRAHQKPGV